MDEDNCFECGKRYIGFTWCYPCQNKRFEKEFGNWTSGNKIIDKFLQKTQSEAIETDELLEWIPYEEFKDIKYLTRGGFGKVYQSIWVDGPKAYWDGNDWVRVKDEVTVLKSLGFSQDINDDFFAEIAGYVELMKKNRERVDHRILQYYGITQNPETKEFLMVIEYAVHGSLRALLSDLKKSGKELTWKGRITFLFNIAHGLESVFKADLVHGDLHSGNILVLEMYPVIGDFGLCKPKTSVGKVTSGVIPYMAPEVLRGEKYTQASDIYSFGMIMWEIETGQLPFSGCAHDVHLVMDICKGLRPPISDLMPKCYSDLICRCWDANPSNRPSIVDIYTTAADWHIRKVNAEEFQKYEKVRRKLFAEAEGTQSAKVEIHKAAVYTSRLLKYDDLPEPVNQLPESHRIEFTMPLDFM
ncbi:hypothetical protein Glove_86g150 [Diversispora epigaea]|uniref:Protein kinase domain-containing protein n=1 Tax=Diversispora epigaea TaxID=1348612 RepID=A0A397J6R3_9GLOM|nr:hypothetical protein Glove_86g150 [Diversispora epigaea]